MVDLPHHQNRRGRAWWRCLQVTETALQTCRICIDNLARLRGCYTRSPIGEERWPQSRTHELFDSIFVWSGQEKPPSPRIELVELRPEIRDILETESLLLIALIGQGIGKVNIS